MAAVINGLVRKENDFKATQYEILLQPYTHITQVSLPDVSKKLANAFNGWLNVSEKNLKQIEDIIQMFQYSNIMLDDVQDNRDSRGPIPSAHFKFGMPHALNALIYAFVDCEKKWLAFDSTRKTYRLRLEYIKNACIARCSQLSWRDTASCPTEEEYYHMIIQQAYLILTLKIQFMQEVSENKKDFIKLCGMFEIYFRILNDYRRLKSNDSACKSKCEDITLGKFSLPIIHAVRTHPDDGKVILDILRLRTENENLIQYVLALLETCGSFEYTRNTLGQLNQEILKEMKKLGNNLPLEKIIKEYFDPSLETVAPNNNGISSFIMKMNQGIPQDEIDLQIKQVLKPLRYLDSISGKKIREGVIKLLKRLLKVPEEKAAIIEHMIHYLHEASLLVDDIQDDSALRRGIPVAHHIFGIANVVNAATYMVAEAESELLALIEPKAIEIYRTLAEKLIRGQGMDIYWRDHCICPSEAEWLDMAFAKTGTIFVLIGKLLALFSTVQKSPKRLLLAIGQFFQINDDYQNLTNQAYFDKKGFCEDLTEGKLSYPVVHAVNARPEEGKIIMDILSKKTYDVELKRYCLSLIKKCGSLEHTKTKLRELRDTIVAEINGFGEDKALFESFLEETVFQCNI